MKLGGKVALVTGSARRVGKVIALAPKSETGYLERGQTLMVQNQFDAALADYNKAIEINPRFAEGHLFLAKLYVDQNQTLDEAVKLARKGLELNPSPEVAPLGHFVMADVYAREGRKAESLREAALGRALESRVKQTAARPAVASSP